MNQLVNVFKLLSDETRLRIILLLAQQELCVCQLSGILNASQPKVSKNLSKLRDLNFVFDERREKFVFYKLKTDNQILMNTVTNILASLEIYPQLVLDQKKLTDIEKYLSQCCPIIE
ncbi:MAG: metalloregulator ArsR/SmtB family transcription factor [Clostridia bacterium]